MDQSFFNGKIEDLIRREAKGAAMAFSYFLTGEEAVLAQNICRKTGAPYFLFGGYDEAERKMLAVSDMDHDLLKQCFPVSLLKFEGAELSKLTNRDVLGALMSTGIRREMLGDIIARDGLVLVFVVEQIKEFLIQNVESVGRQKVHLIEAPISFEIPKPHFEFVRFTAASLRVDAIIGGLIHCSREHASRLIDEKLVLINHVLLTKKTKEVHAGDSIVVRGSGKWIVDECGDLSKKGRAILLCRKYI